MTEEQQQTEFERRKRELYELHLNKILDKINKVKKEENDVEEYLKECRENYLKIRSYTLSLLEKELKELGDYHGQCLHNFEKCYSKYGAFEECNICGFNTNDYLWP